MAVTGGGQLKCRVEAFQPDAGIGGCKAPVSLVVMDVAVVLPGVDLALEGRLVGDTPVEALAGQNGELGLGHIEPAAMLGREVPFEPLGETARLRSRECL